MSEPFDEQPKNNNQYSTYNPANETIYSKKIRAGKRTYFIDVKPTRWQEEYYITLTESKKVFHPTGGHYFEKHKVFLYKEDLNKILAGLTEVIEHVKKDLMPNYDFEQFDRQEEEEELDKENSIKKSSSDDENGKNRLQWQ